MRIRYGWELALAALLVIEIVAFGAINPRMLDLNMLLFSTSDFICIGIVALPLTMVIVSGGIDISFGSTIGLCAIALGVLFQSGVPMPLAILLTLLLGALCGLINAGLIIYTKVKPAGDYAWHAVSVCRKRPAAFRDGRSDGVRRYWWIPDGVYRFR